MEIFDSELITIYRIPIKKHRPPLYMCIGKKHTHQIIENRIEIKILHKLSSVR